MRNGLMFCLSVTHTRGFKTRNETIGSLLSSTQEFLADNSGPAQRVRRVYACRHIITDSRAGYRRIQGLIADSIVQAMMNRR